MIKEKTFTVDSIDGELCQFEHGQDIGSVFELLDESKYSSDYRSLIEEVNKRGQLANEMYRMSRHREQMFAAGFNAGMYIAKFDENEQMTSFEFTDGTRRMLGYDGLDDLPNEFESWIKTLIPEERDTIVKLFWDTVKIHRTLPDISHAEYKMVKKDGSVIWVTGAGEFIRRENGSLEIYMGCYRDVTAEHDIIEHLKVIEGIGKIFNFSLYIDAKTFNYRIISTNPYVESVPKCADAFDFLKANVEATVGNEYKNQLLEWLNPTSILKKLKKKSAVGKNFYSEKADLWFKAIFMVSDYDENGEIAHIIYGCQDINDSKKYEIEKQNEILSQYKLLKSISSIYYSLYEIDLINDTTLAYSYEKNVKQIVNRKSSARQIMTDVINETIDSASLVEALEFTDLSSLGERLNNKKFITNEFLEKNVGWISAMFVTVERDNKGKATKVIFATKSIDDVKKREEFLLKKSTTDELTGALNRAAYETAITELDKNGLADDFVYVSVDVNGLKVVNDTLGHAAGDELIKGAYICLSKSIGNFGNIYRTGGDEFVVLANIKKKQISNILDMLKICTDRWSGELVDSVSLSYGYATIIDNSDLSVHQLAVIADKEMYDAKSNYYKEKGIDRRGQKDAHKALCDSYTKILRVNLTNDSYDIVDMESEEKDKAMGFSEKISVWLKNFGTSGQVHPDDLDEYLKKTDLSFVKNYFLSGKSSLFVFYRRKYGNEFKQSMMEMIPTESFTDENLSLYLFVKNIDK